MQKKRSVEVGVLCGPKVDRSAVSSGQPRATFCGLRANCVGISNLDESMSAKVDGLMSERTQP